ncbi:MAG: transcriptional regulator with DNA-binding domain and aminotransferase domain [Chitinophagaceae bacterium]|nr:transcriptional regulator with DNA-binding domain and aminotransferase domain [Chitinophagaceae bacterium]
MTTTTNTGNFSGRAQQVQSSFIRDILKAAGQSNIISFAGGLPEPSLFPAQQLAKSAYRVLMNNGQEALQYTNTEGYLPLRKFIAERYLRQQKIPIEPEQVLITSGSQQALDLISKLFLDPGDEIIVERPSYLGAIQCFSQYSPLIQEVDLKEEGPDGNQLKEWMKTSSPKFFYTIPNYQNPTGRRHSIASRHDTASIIAESDAFIIEDDPYGEIRFEGETFPTLHSLLPEQTILLGTFSKMVAPGLRIGWVIATPDIIRRLTILKQASDLHSSHLDQQIIYDYLTHYDLEEHLQSIRMLYSKRRNTMLAAMREYFPESVKYQIPEGGMFFWLEFGKQFKTMELLEKSMKEGIIFVPGETFYASNPVLNTARFNFSNTEEDKMKAALSKLGALIKKMEQPQIATVKWWPLP